MKRQSINFEQKSINLLDLYSDILIKIQNLLDYKSYLCFKFTCHYILDIIANDHFYAKVQKAYGYNRMLDHLYELGLFPGLNNFLEKYNGYIVFGYPLMHLLNEDWQSYLIEIYLPYQATVINNRRKLAMLHNHQNDPNNNESSEYNINPSYKLLLDELIDDYLDSKKINSLYNLAEYTTSKFMRIDKEDSTVIYDRIAMYKSDTDIKPVQICLIYLNDRNVKTYLENRYKFSSCKVYTNMNGNINADYWEIIFKRHSIKTILIESNIKNIDSKEAHLIKYNNYKNNNNLY